MKNIFPKTGAYCLLPIQNTYHANFLSLYRTSKSQALQGCEKRKNEFMSGRLCVANCMSQLGFQSTIIESKTDRSPDWPDNIIGSISHSNSFALAFIDTKQNSQAVGIDIQPKTSDATAKELRHMILSPDEIDRFKRHDDQTEVFDLIFSAKEALFKALYPECQIIFGHYDAEVTSIDFEINTITLSLLRDLGSSWKQGEVFLVRFTYDAPELVTFLYLPTDK